ncbi:hypothetical protein RN001_005331 [Aquatica leii]|uniref:Uncharacterized protein n=1 Tax=Aquatica leii TaxID=1421715 RepID=A0AAN7PBS7_9COLE|nr:hypothetical protein RN001_005331 [Aquatica leii]
MSPSKMHNECRRYLENLKVTPEQREEIANNTIGQFNNPLYRSERNGRLTASNFGTVIKRREWTSCHSHVKNILTPQNYTCDAIEFGKMHESQSGFFIDLDFPFLGASPDGKVKSNEYII